MKNDTKDLERKKFLNCFIQLSEKIAEAHSIFTGRDCQIKFEHNDSKEYWSIQCEFKRGNAKFSDVVIFYDNPENFDSEKVVEDFEEIFEKAKRILIGN